MKKYTDVDIIAELQKLVDSHVDSYKEDFDIDKRIIRRAAESQQIELAVMRQMPANRIQHPLWQFLAAIHRNLPGSMT